MTEAHAPRSGMENVSSTAASARVRGCGAPDAAAANGERASQLRGIVRSCAAGKMPCGCAAKMKTPFASKRVSAISS
jgi:hypothetical protein